MVERNFPASSYLLDRARKNNQIADVAKLLEVEYDPYPQHTLELRDHVTYYLGMWDVYFAVQVSSANMLRLLTNHVGGDVQVFMIDFVKRLLDQRDSRFNQFYASVETISKGQYAVVLPQILTLRSEELENCIIHYKRGPVPLYCTVNLLRTYYGQKIVSAIANDEIFESVVSEKTFGVIAESLQAAGIDVSKMLVGVDPAEWEEIVCKADKIESHPEESKELRTLHRVHAARSEIFLDSFRKQAAALDTILNAKTQLCNDVLMMVASDTEHDMRLRALKGLGDNGDSKSLEFLSSMLNDGEPAVRNVVARAISTLASHSKWSSFGHKTPQGNLKAPSLDISKINRILTTLVAKGMPIAMIEDTLIAVTTQGGMNAVEILIRLLAKPDANIRKAVIKSSRLLERNAAAPIVRAALKDQSPEIVAMAEEELNSRWPDEVWR